MAHNLDSSKGFHAFVSKKVPAWHNLGTILPRTMTAQDLLTYGGLDFEVVKAPNIHRIMETAKDIKTGENTSLTYPVDLVSSESFFTYRADTNHILAPNVGKQYTPVQNSELIDVMEQFEVEYETAGVINNGGRVFVSAKPTRLALDKNDLIDFYILFMNGHDGSLSLGGCFTNIRVVCNNTLSAAVSQMKGRGASDPTKFSLRHTSGIKNKMVDAARLMGLYHKQAESMVEVFKGLQKAELSKHEMMNYFGNLFIDADDQDKLRKGAKATEILSTRKQNQLGDLLNYAYSGVGQAEAGEGSAWWAYNAVSGYLSNFKKYGSEDDRMNSLVIESAPSSSAKIIDKALTLCIDKNLIKPLHNSQFGSLNNLN